MALRAVSTLYAGLVVLSALVTLTVYALALLNQSIDIVKQQEMMFIRAQRISSNVRIENDTLMLPEPVDIIIVDPNGVPHLARKASLLKVPWNLNMTEIYLVLHGRVSGGFSSHSVVAVAKLHPSTIIWRNYEPVPSNSLSQSSENLTSTITALERNLSLIANAVIDPIIVAAIENPNAVNAYRGLVLLDENTTALPYAIRLVDAKEEGWDTCALGIGLRITYVGKSVSVRLKPLNCSSWNPIFTVEVGGNAVRNVSGYGVHEINHPFNVNGLKCLLERVTVDYGYLVGVGSVNGPFAYPTIMCGDGAFTATITFDRVGSVRGVGVYEPRVNVTYILPRIADVDAVLAKIVYYRGVTGSVSTGTLYVLAYPGFGNKMTITMYRNDDPAWGEGYYVEISGGTVVGDINNTPVYAARRLVLTIVSNGYVDKLYRFVKVG